MWCLRRTEQVDHEIIIYHACANDVDISENRFRHTEQLNRLINHMSPQIIGQATAQLSGFLPRSRLYKVAIARESRLELNKTSK